MRQHWPTFTGRNRSAAGSYFHCCGSGGPITRGHLAAKGDLPRDNTLAPTCAFGIAGDPTSCFHLTVVLACSAGWAPTICPSATVSFFWCIINIGAVRDLAAASSPCYRHSDAAALPSYPSIAGLPCHSRQPTMCATYSETWKHQNIHHNRSWLLQTIHDDARDCPCACSRGTLVSLSQVARCCHHLLAR